MKGKIASVVTLALPDSKVIRSERLAHARQEQHAPLPMTIYPSWFEASSVPPGFAHGTFFPVDSWIEYLCSSEDNPSERNTCQTAADS